MIANEFQLMKLEVEFGVKPDAYQVKLAEQGIRVYLGDFMREGFKMPTPFYLWECPVHGLVYDYPHGYGRRFECPQCREAGLL